MKQGAQYYSNMNYSEAILLIQRWYKKKIYMRQSLIKKLNKVFLSNQFLIWCKKDIVNGDLFVKKIMTDLNLVKLFLL